MGVRGRSPRNFITNFIKFVKFQLNHHRNIVIVIISQKFGGGQLTPHAPMVATALHNEQLPMIGVITNDGY